MAGFNFAKGNAQKLLALPLYALGFLASAVVPRKPGRWVFGCGSGVGEGALELCLLARESDPSLDITWLARDERDLADAAGHGIPAVRKSTLRGLWCTLRAQIVVVTHGLGDANRFGSRGAFIVQLWHGIPLKLIQLDSAATMRSGSFPGAGIVRGFLRAAYRRGFSDIRLMPASSETAAIRVRTAFGLPAERVVVTGDPRDDVLSRGTATERATTARANLSERLGVPLSGRRVLLYAPTWRDGAPDPGAPTPEQWRRIDDHLRSTGSVLIVRPHPLGVGDYRAGVDSSQSIHLLGSDLQPHITPVLPAVDLLITDYSSIAYDYSLTGGPVLYLAPDEDAYVESRGLYEPYRVFSDGREVRGWDGILDQLRRFDTDAAWAAEVTHHTETLRAEHHAYRDGRNTGRVYAEILRRLKATE